MAGLPVPEKSTRRNGRPPSHGESSKATLTPEYVAWKNMIDRCANPNRPDYKNYGGRGIEVCDRWRWSYEAFLADVGRRPHPGLSLDRIDNDKGYFPGNVHWATPTEQVRNQRNTRLVEHAGRVLAIAAWADETGIPYTVLCARHAKGWSAGRMLTQPLKIIGRRKQHHGGLTPQST